MDPEQSIFKGHSVTLRQILGYLGKQMTMTPAYNQWCKQALVLVALVGFL